MRQKAIATENSVAIAFCHEAHAAMNAITVIVVLTHMLITGQSVTGLSAKLIDITVTITANAIAITEKIIVCHPTKAILANTTVRTMALAIIAVMIGKEVKTFEE